MPLRFWARCWCFHSHTPATQGLQKADATLGFSLTRGQGVVFRTVTRQSHRGHRILTRRRGFHLTVGKV